MGHAKSPLHEEVAMPLLEFDLARISYTRAHEMATCAAFLNESRMNFINADRLNRKSGVWRGDGEFHQHNRRSGWKSNCRRSPRSSQGPPTTSHFKE
jgi:hypothetical protein